MVRGQPSFEAILDGVLHSFEFTRLPERTCPVGAASDNPVNDLNTVKCATPRSRRMRRASDAFGGKKMNPVDRDAFYPNMPAVISRTQTTALSTSPLIWPRRSFTQST